MLAPDGAPYGSPRIPAPYRAENLLLARESHTIPIPSARSDRRYELRIAVQRIDAGASPDGAIHHRVTGTLAETHANGRLLRKRRS